LLRTLYRADTPLLHSRTPWISFEYRDDCGGRDSGWVDVGIQRELIKEGVMLFERIFGTVPLTACAPGYRANDDTRRVYAEVGICVAQNGPALPLAPYIDRSGLLLLHRNVPFEPAMDPDHYNEKYALSKAGEAFRGGRPIIVCMHSINFHSTLKNNRELTLDRLDRFLSLLEETYRDLLYLNDRDLWDIVTTGGFEWNGERQDLDIVKRWQPSPSLMDYLIRKRMITAPRA
jgi:hypothetical protein